MTYIVIMICHFLNLNRVKEYGIYATWIRAVSAAGWEFIYPFFPPLTAEIGLLTFRPQLVYKWNLSFPAG